MATLKPYYRLITLQYLITIWVRDDFLAIVSTLFIRVISLRKYTAYLLPLNITILGIKLRWIL